MVVRWPNLALWMRIAAQLLSWTGAPASYRAALTRLGRGALVSEGSTAVRGLNLFWRLLGAVVLAVQLSGFA